MRLVEFLIYLLATQAQTLQRLAAFFGEDELLEMLESAGEMEDKSPSNFIIDPEWFEKHNSHDTTSVYTKLEGAVHELKLPAILEFHLWAYPFYRAIVESPLDLKYKIRDSGTQTGEALINEAVIQSNIWIKKLPMPPEASLEAERAALVPWLRFRTEVLKKIGKRPFVSV